MSSIQTKSAPPTWSTWSWPQLHLPVCSPQFVLSLDNFNGSTPTTLRSREFQGLTAFGEESPYLCSKMATSYSETFVCPLVLFSGQCNTRHIIHAIIFTVIHQLCTMCRTLMFWAAHFRFWTAQHVLYGQHRAVNMIHYVLSTFVFEQKDKF